MRTRLLLLAAIAALGPAAQHRLDAAERPAFASRAQLVIVPVTVTDARGATVNGLARDAFSLFEGKVTRPIASFSEEDEPVSIGVIFDASGSMKSALGGAKSALRSFMETCNPEDEAFLDIVSTRPTRISGFTRDFGILLEAVAGSGAGGDTALIDAVYGGLRELRLASRPRKALLVISDGMDNHSRHSRADLMSVAVESGAQIYAISLYAPPLNKKAIELAEEQRGLVFLSDLASKSGGMHLVVRTPGEIAAAGARIGRALRNQYVIGYVPASSNVDGRWHSIKVDVSVPGTRVYARSGYRAAE